MAKARFKKADTGANLGFEAKLWAAADALRNNMDAARVRARRTHRELSDDEIAKIAGTYHPWRGDKG
ncbi:MAG: hypothetical protein HY908_20615 [Myxococcales bacterium]|nr:hypothetical protein [Myxococcales bacterium]